MGIETHADLPREKSLEGEPAGKIAQGEIVVQLDEKFRIRVGKKILAWDFPGIDSAERNCGLVTSGDHQFRGPANIALANKQIQVAIGAHRRVAIRLHREHWPFYDKGTDSLRGEPVQYAKQLRRQPQSKKILHTLAIDKRLPYFRRDQALFETAETRCQMAGHAVFFREDEQASPIHGTEQASKPLTITRW
jgi:hypothetical protein